MCGHNTEVVDTFISAVATRYAYCIVACNYCCENTSKHRQIFTPLSELPVRAVIPFGSRRNAAIITTESNHWITAYLSQQ
jgi:hypothetical protein